jgi:uncharacterized coiled-coil DUF342 family protein
MEKETTYKQIMIELVEELQGFKYALFTWKEDLEKYRKQVAEFSKIFVKLSEIAEKQLQEQNKIFEDKWAKLIATTSYMDSKVEKLYSFMENRLVNLITELSTTVSKTNDGLVKVGEVLEKFVEGQVKTNGLLEDVKKLLEQQLEIRKKADLEARKVRRKIEEKLGE